MKTYPVNEMFMSLQGEGHRAGTPNVFVRLAGCNQTCKTESHGFDCDTEFVSSRPMTAADLLASVRDLWRAETKPNVIVTGGEPLLHLDDELGEQLLESCETVAIETNGSRPLPESLLRAYGPSRSASLFVSCSPKVAEHAVRLQVANELRYVRAGGQGIPKPALAAEFYYLSPAWDGDGFDREALATCRRLVEQNPTWRLSTQQHKVWSVR